MALKWVKACKTLSRISVNGRRERYHPGDWFQARNMEIRQRLARGEIILASDIGIPRIYKVEDCGVVTADTSFTEARLGVRGIGLEITYTADFVLQYPYTLFWNGGTLRTELLPTSFELLKKWEIAIPLVDFGTLAEGVGTEEDRKLTLSVLGDLRVPLYDIRQIYARRCPAVSELLQVWKAEQEKIQEGDARLAFLRALYPNPLLILALPPSWIAGINVR